MKSVYSAVRTGALNKVVYASYFRTNNDLCHLQHKLIGFYSRDEKCLQRGTDWGGLLFVCKGDDFNVTRLKIEVPIFTENNKHVYCLLSALHILILRVVQVSRNVLF